MSSWARDEEDSVNPVCTVICSAIILLDARAPFEHSYITSTLKLVCCVSCPSTNMSLASFKSFADQRLNNIVKWHIDGYDYFWAVSEILDSATECIMIQDCGRLFLRRPPAQYPEWRIDRLIKRKAAEGVKVYILVYKEVTQVTNISSRHTEASLTKYKKYRRDIYWGHNEKVVIVDNHFACVGGLDLCFGRWDTHSHPLADAHPTEFLKTLFPGQYYNNARIMDFQQVDNFASNAVSILQTPRMPWHDAKVVQVHMTLVGPVVLDLVQHFVERWNELKLRKYKTNTRYDWLAFPHDIIVAPNEPIARLYHHDEFTKGRKFRQRFQKGPNWTSRENDHPYEEPPSGCTVQVIRSCSDWSHGVSKEQSIQNTYIELIRDAEHYIYIENQFFISNTGNHGPVKNRIAQALVERILRAAREGKKFKVVVLFPEIPGIAGDISERNNLSIILAATWRTINRGGHSIYEEIKAAGFEPNDYVRFFHLRSYDRINAPWPSFIQEIEQNRWTQAKVVIKQPDSTREDLVEEKELNVEPVDCPDTVEEALEIIKKFEAGVIRARDDFRVSDSIAYRALTNETSLLEEKWLGTDEEEYNSYVTEILHIHSKLMIVDDRRVICGSANINDRSQKGDGDSEIALLVEDTDMIDGHMDGESYKVARFASSLRRKLYREHLGLIRPETIGIENDFMRAAPIPNPDEFGLPEDNLVADPMSIETEDLWNGTAARNRAIFAELFKAVPSDAVRNLEQYRESASQTRVYRLAPGQSLDRVKEQLAQVRGHLVETPLEFLIEERGIWENIDWMGLNPTLPVYI
ncbi:phospholipase D/nuclease [Serendipita vermifera]|nr:phospholipase D/nuclease [Serendipita vermifera]